MLGVDIGEPPKADIAERNRHVRFVPKADMVTALFRSRRYETSTPAAVHNVDYGD